MKRTICLLTLILVALSNLASAVPADARRSVWSPWLVTRQNVTREEFARAIESNDRKVLRVDAIEFARAWESMGIPAGQELRQVAAFIRSGDVGEMDCDQSINRFELARVNHQGKVDFNLARRGCYPGEKFLVWKGQTFVSLGCGNPMRERERPKVRQTAVAIPAPGPLPKGCPDVHTLKMNVWPSSALNFPGVQQAIAAAEAAKVPDFRNESRMSRHLGGELRAEAGRNPNFQRSSTPHLFRMSLIRVDQNDRVIAEQPLGDYEVTGLREFKFTREQLSWDAIRIVDLREEMRSPVFHSISSLREARFYNTSLFRGLPMGEWSTNPTPDCVMNVHAIEALAGNTPVTFGGAQAFPPAPGSY